MSSLSVHAYGKSPIDHYIQGDILKKLYRSYAPLSFTTLKDDGIENSLFMYHMRKLEQRGLVMRTPDGYLLSESGVRWINFIGPNTLQPKMLPRPLISFLMFNADKSKLVVSKRIGIHSQFLHDLLLPGGLHLYGQSVASASTQIYQKITARETVSNFVGICEVLHHFPDSFSHHTIAFIHQINLPDTSQIPTNTEHFQYEWMPVEDLLTMRENDSFITKILHLFKDQQLSGFQTIEFNHK